MSGDFTGEMVETRNISRSQEATMESLQNTILEMQRRMEQMHQDMQRMRSGESTSHGQNSNGRNGNGMASMEECQRLSSQDSMEMMLKVGCLDANISSKLMMFKKI